MKTTLEEDHYIAPLKYDWLTSFYDPLLRLTLREETFKRQLIQQANIAPNHRVLDLGCGTATLTLLIKQLHPRAEVVGLDGDAKALALAQNKITQAGVEITLVQSLSYQMDFSDASFDRVLSSLVFHHLTAENKYRTLKEIFRVLKPGGALHVADWGKAQNMVMRSAFLLVQMLDGFVTTTENVQGKLPHYFREAGFANIRETKRYMTVYGTLSLYAAMCVKQ
ncbi:methyltransferase domain-containing protein [bacterium]|nr:methyltransferase domain-containing protein [bacterium]